MNSEVSYPSAAILLCTYIGDDADLFEVVVKSIPDCVNSIKLNIYLHVDGPISGATGSFIDRNRTRFYKVFYSDVNIGLAAGLNKLVDNLDDEDFIFRVDADDENINDRFLKTIDFLMKNPMIDIVGGQVLEVSDDNSFDDRVVSYFSGNIDLNRFILYRSPLAHNTVCFRRRVFVDGNRYPISSFTEDIAFWSVLLLRGYKINNVDQPFVRSRIGKKFFQRRGLKRATIEFFLYMRLAFRHGYPVYGVSLAMIRFFVRLLPSSFKAFAYSLRTKF